MTRRSTPSASPRPRRDGPRTPETAEPPGAPPSESEVDERLTRIWKRAYGAKTTDDLKRLYADWAETYDEDHDSIGFRGHEIAAEVLACHTTRHDVARVLDAGAGTGAAGEALHERGFRNMVAIDLSEDMLARAREKGIYTNTLAADLSLPIDAFGAASFDAAILVGVFSYGQAPPETLDEILRLVRPGGVVVFTMRTDFHGEDAMGVRSRIEVLESSGAWSRLEVTEPDLYLPKKDPNALYRVWCYRVTGGRDSEVEDGFEQAVREAFESDDRVIKIDHAWIWDSTASRLYDRYTRTGGYYLTDCEEEILKERADEICSGGQELVVELGCGSARKIAHVLRGSLRQGRELLRYVPIDVSLGALESTAGEVRRRFPEVEIEPRQGLFEDVLNDIPDQAGKLVFFFGSSLGNLDTVDDTIAFLRRLREQLHERDRLVVGLDLHKGEDVLERAYDEEECCRSFFVHMVRRINEHLGADFDPRVFELSSTYEEEEPPKHDLRSWRMNLRIAPTRPQSTYVQDLDMEVHLDRGQPIQVGISRKFEPEGIRRLAALAGFRLERQWLDRRGWFSLNELAPSEVPA